VAGQDGILKKVSRSLVKILGYSEETLLTTPFFDFIHPDDKEATRKSIEALNLGVPSVGFENRYRASDGSYRTFSWSAAADAELGVRFASARDITNERSFKIHVQQILDSAPFLLVVKDLDRRIIDCNAPFARSVGASRESLIGKNADIYLPVDAIAASHEKEREVLGSQQSLTFEEVLENQGVKARYLSTVFPILDQTGKTVCLGKVSLMIR
jgi:PAS domain S-box-containing protein